MVRFVSVVALGLLAACGGKSTSEPAEPAPAPAPEEAPLANTAPPPEPEPAPDEPVYSAAGIPACDEYIALVYRYISCDKVPQDARDAARQGIDAVRQGWADIANVPDDVKLQVNDACKQANDALRQGASAMGCPI